MFLHLSYATQKHMVLVYAGNYAIYFYSQQCLYILAYTSFLNQGIWRQSSNFALITFLR